MCDDKVGVSTVGTLRADDVIAGAARKPRFGAEVVERWGVKVTQHRRRAGGLHREIVMRALPLLELLDVAVTALRYTDKARFRWLGPRRFAACNE